ncbi:MAG TPA: CdaR family protein [Verrucomicrobiae bacterium]|nr:CdaR family protein [Verrucomicrobiae bacterium]
MPWRSYIVHNFWWKLLSILLATLIWLAIHSSIDGDVRFTPATNSSLPVEFVNLPITVLTVAADLRGFKVSPDMVSVTLAGDPETLKKVRPRDIQVFVNLTERRDMEAASQRIQVIQPPGTVVTQVTPPFVRVERVSP